jgi:RimJ/RimL family protein N-acetyltransferase
MRPPTRSTRQLLLRAPEPADADALFAIQGDAEAMRFTFCAPDRAATAAFLASYERRGDLDGFAPWIAQLAEDGRVAGWGGLNVDPKAPHYGVEVAYFFDRRCWGRGLATELVLEALRYARELGLAEVGAFVMPENRASVRVLEKAGFARTRFVPELARDEYRRPAK